MALPTGEKDQFREVQIEPVQGHRTKRNASVLRELSAPSESL